MSLYCAAVTKTLEKVMEVEELLVWAPDFRDSVHGPWLHGTENPAGAFRRRGCSSYSGQRGEREYELKTYSAQSGTWNPCSPTRLSSALANRKLGLCGIMKGLYGFQGRWRGGTEGAQAVGIYTI